MLAITETFSLNYFLYYYSLARSLRDLASFVSRRRPIPRKYHPAVGRGTYVSEVEIVRWKLRGAEEKENVKQTLSSVIEELASKWSGTARRLHFANVGVEKCTATLTFQTDDDDDGGDLQLNIPFVIK